MSPSHVTAQTVTNASGTIALASTSTNIGVTQVVNAAPVTGAEHLIHTAGAVLSLTEITGLCSAAVLILSFLWNIHSTRRKLKQTDQRNAINEKFYQLRKEEHELELAKYKIEKKAA